MGAVATWLYVPAPRIQDRLAKAVAAADAVVIDLEDATHPSERPAARAQLAGLAAQPVPVAVRVNQVDSDDFAADVAAVGPLLAAGIVRELRLPKVESPEDVAAALAVTGRFAQAPHLACQLESARGLRFAHEIAASPGVCALMLGEADLRADLGLPRGEGADVGLLLARLTVVQAARAAGLPSPSGSVFANVKDVAGLSASCLDLRRLGFHGRSVIHPAQVQTVREVFAPTAEELAWATAVTDKAGAMDLAGTASVALDDGSFVDPAIVRQASDLLARALA